MFPSHGFRSLLVTGALLGVCGGPGAAQEPDPEEILSYHVLVDVARDGVLTVTEQIAVRALGRKVRRGIYRDFPTRFPTAHGLTHVVAPFDVVEVKRDGRFEPYVLETTAAPGGRAGVRVRIGNPDVTLEPGVHEYAITYTTERWLQFGDDTDRLYWNATGNGWDLPILESSATVRLPRTPPPGAVVLDGWTGPDGSTERAVAAVWQADQGVAVIRATRPLDANEGLTISVTFPKGVVDPPTPEQEAEWFRLDWGGYVDAGWVVALVMAVYVLMWWRVGRDPRAGVRVVRYEPPEGFSPAALGFLDKRGYSPALFSAALVSLGVRGALRIEKQKKRWRVTRMGTPTEPLPPDERKVLENLLGTRDHLELAQRRHTTIRGAMKAQAKALKAAIETRYFVNNRTWFIAGLAVTVVGYATLVWRWRYDVPPAAWFMGLWLTFWNAGVITMLVRLVRSWRSALSGAGGCGAWAESIFMTLFVLPFVGADVFVAYMFQGLVPRHLVAAALVLGAVNVLFYHLLEAPTLRGRGVLDELDGFKDFLTATDADRLDRMTEPQRTPELFERYLPHAIALGVESRWAARFEDVLAGAATGAADSSRSMLWYGGPGGLADVGSLASSLGTSFTSSISSSSAAPGGGGSSGGGSSGGGGGGGGGGGW